MAKSTWSEEQKKLTAQQQRDRIETELHRRRTAEILVDNPRISTPAPLPDENGLNPNSLEKWVKSQFAPNTPLDVKFEIATHLFVERAISSISEMRGKDAMIAAGIAAEKMQLLRGLPTAIVGVIPLLVKIGEKASDNGIELKAIIQAIWDEMSKK